MRHPALLSLALCLLPLTCAAEPARFEVGYARSQDQACAVARGYEINDEWVRELNEALPAFRELWKVKGPAMFKALEALTNRAAEPFAAPVRLTLCDTPSQPSSGLSVNMRFALRSFTPTPVSLRYKVDTAFHEVLHGFVAQYAPRNSPLLAAHKSEPACVINHLHLLALQKAVLTMNGETAALEQVIAIDSQLPTGCYKRAWAIVNEAGDTYKQYVAEIAKDR